MGQTIPGLTSLTGNSSTLEVGGIKATKHTKITDYPMGTIWKCVLGSGEYCAMKEVNLKYYKTQRLYQKEVSLLTQLR